MKKLLMMLTMFLVCSLVTLPVYAQEVLETEKVELTEEEKEFKRVLEIAYNSSISIKWLNEAGGMGFCTGTLITNEKDNVVVLTAKHCLDSMAVEVYADGIRVTNFGYDNYFDLAWIKLDEQLINRTPIKFASKNANINDLVFVYAYPPRHDYYVEGGLVNLKARKYHYAKVKVIGGCSGGGVFNMNGELVGVLWGSVTDMMIYTPVEDLKRVLRRENIRYEIVNY